MRTQKGKRPLVKSQVAELCRALLTNTRNVSHAPSYEQLERDMIWPWLTIARKLLRTVLANVSYSTL